MTFAKKIPRLPEVPGLPGVAADVTTDEGRRIERLRARKKELEERIGALHRRAVELDEIELFQREVAELEAELKAMQDIEKRSSAMDPIRQLETIEKAVANATAEPARLRKAAEDVYDDVVERITRTEGCDARRAHYLASKDPIGKRAYAQVVELQDRARAARDGAGRIGAFLG